MFVVAMLTSWLPCLPVRYLAYECVALPTSRVKLSKCFEEVQSRRRFAMCQEMFVCLFVCRFTLEAQTLESAAQSSEHETILLRLRDESRSRDCY